MKIKYERDFRNLPGNERKVCLALTFLEGGLRDAARSEGQQRTWIAYQGKKIVGWGILSNSNDLMLYVRRSHRQQGIGDALYRRIIAYWKRHLRYKTGFRRKPMVYPHDGTSTKFFKKYQPRLRVPKWLR